MMERKFTDDEIVKALGVCNYYAECDKCPFDGECRRLNPYALDLINRQKAEIERLKKDNEYILMQHAFQRRPSGDCWNDVIEKAKTEAIKEFAERLKESCFGNPYLDDDVLNELTDNLVKEMTNKLEENNNER